MQVPRKHFPVVGLIALVLVAAAGGSIYYYQFVLPHNKNCGVPVNRVIFLQAIIQEVTPNGGFNIIGAATVNKTTVLPSATNSTSLDFSGIAFNWYNSSITNRKSIEVNQGDNVTIYMFAVNSTNPAQYTVSGPSQGRGHGFGIDGYPIRVMRLVDYQSWGETSFGTTAAGSFTYRCLHSCSDQHPSMTGSLVVSACG